MALFYLPLLSFFLLSATADHAVSPAEVYWKTALPNTPIPDAIQVHLHPTGTKYYYESDVSPFRNGYYKATTPAEFNDKMFSMFFLEKDLLPGTKMSPHFTTGTRSGAPFLPHRVSDSIPFSSEKLPQILDRLSIKPGSVEAEATKNSLRECEEPEIDRERKLCATSLESMVEFTASVLGTHNVRAMSTSLVGKVGAGGEGQQYTVVSRKMVGSKLVACHAVKYPYAVFYCHTLSGIRGYTVELVGAADGLAISAVAVCHRDTSAWSPKSAPLQLFNVKPGEASVCHFMPRDHVTWVPAVSTKE